LPTFGWVSGSNGCLTSCWLVGWWRSICHERRTTSARPAMGGSIRASELLDRDQRRSSNDHPPAIGSDRGETGGDGQFDGQAVRAAARGHGRGGDDLWAHGWSR
jgi:hypothetical protein